MIKCGECGYENMDGLDYCDGCGAKITPAATSSDGAIAPAAEPPPTEPAAPSASEAPTGEIKPPPEAAPEGAEPAPETPAAAPAAPAPSAAVPTAAVPQFKAKFQITRGGRKGQEFPLEDGNNFIG